MLKLSQSINRAYRQVKITTDNFNRFILNLKNLLSNISIDESEEYTKTHLMDFLKNTYFHPDFLVAQKGKIDFVIHSSKKSSSPVAVLFEVKKSNNTNEMVTLDDLNRKGMQEILLYYLRERIDSKNTELKYLVITNIHEYYIFDSQEFERIFYSNRKLIKEYCDFKEERLVSSSTDFFYKEIASKYIEEVKDKIEFTHFDLRDYLKLLDRNDTVGNKKLVELYKAFSPVHLLKQSLQNDSNTLDKNFYNELLHIMGLQEISKKNKKIITRLPAKNRQEGSIIENAINIIDAEERLEKIPNLLTYGSNKQEQLYNVAMELAITWINRILFLKLLEAQLIKYQKDDKHYGFLNSDKIPDYDELNRLYFQVLARGNDERTAPIKDKYSHVPYLNSSLFEVSELEHNTITMSNLDSSLYISIPTKTVLKSKRRKLEFEKLPTLKYLFMFLDAYDFSSEGDEGIKDEAKTLISASVLGLIFEKINGHKDGAVFTPGYITMYICREAIEKVIIRKFNDYYEWQCGNLIDLHNKINDITQANNIINSLKICDPAVGSGHFLVSALNEIIRIKYELGILSDNNGKRIRDYKVEVANDELIITDDEGLSFSYNPQSPESQRIQETIFREKQTIIENCLFGIDINPNSVKICRLRLWIELLKNAFYTKESEYKKLETLPNIDINIKCGNSLLRRFNLNTDIRQMLAKTGIKISDYKEAVYEYKNAPSKIRKKEVHNMINIIKSTLCTEISNNDKKVKELRNNKNKLIDLESPDLFELTAKEKRSIAKDIAKLKRDIAKTENLFEEIRSNKFYLGAFEWRLEFPEVLNNDGDFNGFDCIIGNPPYIQLQKMRKEAAILKQIGYKTFAKSADIFCLFYELGTQLLKEGGLLAYITSNSWLRAGYGKTLKGFLLDNSNITQLIDFPEIRVFESATVRTNILFAESSAYEGVTQVCSVDKTNFCREKLGDYFTKNSISTNLVNNNSWTALSPIEEQIKEKIKIVGKPLKDWNINIFRGILTGYNNAFIIDGETKEKLIQKSPNSTEIIQPILRGKDVKSYKADFADLWIINTHNGYEEVPEISIDNYPGIKEHLDKYISNLQERQDKGCTPYNLRSCIYMKEFSKPKIVWKRVGSNVRFCYDETGCMTLDSTCFATGDHIKYLTIFLNSKIGKYLLKYSPKTGTGDLLISVQAIDPLLVPIPDNETENKLNSMLDIITSNINELKDIEQIQGEIDSILYNLYDLSDEEIEFIEAQ